MIHTLIAVTLAALAATASPVVIASQPEPLRQSPPQPAAHPARPTADTPPRTSAKLVVTGTININTASAIDLQRLPGIGAKTADRVIEYRQKNGPFKKVEELMNVRGVGEKGFLKVKNQVSVAAAKTDRAASQP